MSFKTVLKIALGIVIFILVTISFKWKTKKKEVMIEHSTQTRVDADVVDIQLQNMHNANAQSDGMMFNQDGTQSRNTKVEAPQTSTPNETKSALVNKGSYTIRKANAFGCANEKLLNDLLKYVSANDDKKLNKYLNKGLDRGDCTKFEQGEKVILEESSPHSSIAKVRKVGESQLWWINTDILK